MAAFEFVLVLVSIIVGLAITEVFRGVARVLRGDLKPYSLHSFWVVQVFLHQVQSWWSYRVLNAYEAFTFPEMIALATLALTSQPRVHAALTILCVAGLGGYIAVFTPDLASVATTPR